VENQYGVTAIGQTDEVREQFYAISVERKISHPAVSVITEAAREWLFTKAPQARGQKKVGKNNGKK
jgi:LysR family transcriptional activator of nhaA